MRNSADVLPLMHEVMCILSEGVYMLNSLLKIKCNKRQGIMD